MRFNPLLIKNFQNRSSNLYTSNKVLSAILLCLESRGSMCAINFTSVSIPGNVLVDTLDSYLQTCAPIGEH